MRLSSLILLLVLVAGCETKSTYEADIELTSIADKAIVREAKRGLSQDIAVLRKKQISNPEYELNVVLNAEGQPFHGDVKVTFDFVAQGSDLTLDFNDGEVIDVLLNGKNVPFTYNNYFLTFSEANFPKGKNTLAIKFRHAYSKEGSGLYYFKDPLDDTVYTYSDLEPFAANQIFPLFDQPNLKATYILNADVPSNWIVVSTMRETEMLNEGDRTLWKFPITPLMSSYVVSLHAGEYATFDLGTYEGIPLRLFSRQSNKDYVPVEEWNKITRQGFAFFNDFFGIAYPFGKYDQLAVPDFNSGAMENVGAVTFADQYCCVPGERSLQNKTFFMNSILHEQAHMWFGNLVTMDWWNDIWLNESFAEYAGYLAFSGGTEFEHPWLENLWARKLWGYREDDAISTHPIKTNIENTETVMSSIDGIAYAKGSSVLRQLSYYLGDRKFKQGVQTYMKKYAYKNARFEDLLNELSLAAGRPMDDWAEIWLKTSGVNRVATTLECENEKISKLELTQSSKGKKLQVRPQHFKLALYPADEEILQDPVVLEVKLTTEVTAIAEAIGQSCPALILPNFGDYGYMKLVLDELSRSNLNVYLDQVKDPHARALFWVALWDGVSDGRYPLSDYLDVALSQVSGESNLQILDGIRSGLSTSQSMLFKMQGENIRQYQKRYADKFAAIALVGLKASDPKGDRFQIWSRMYRDFTYMPAQLDQVAVWLSKNDIESWSIDQSTRWRLLSILAAKDYPNIKLLLDAERVADSSARGHRFYISSQTILANGEEKLAAFSEAIEQSNEESLGNKRTVIRSLFPRRQSAIHRQISRTILNSVVEHADSISTDMMHELTRNNLPRYYDCSDSWDIFIEEILARNTIKHQPLRDALLESAETNARCLKVRRLIMPVPRTRL